MDATQPDGRRSYWKSENLPGLDPVVGQKVIENANTIPSPHSSVILIQVDGALNGYDEDYAPIGNHDAKQVLLLAGSW